MKTEMLGLPKVGRALRCPPRLSLQFLGARGVGALPPRDPKTTAAPGTARSTHQ
ncbi:hypothetical protein Oter_1365 [Opitutus terrae PB90-1]|uniref:Uncharacterized protein n=1 Tax=Opitutus terrae (strain DSM 11246 / JCM 15787 / PB90-1) TaxID=452637 RepID=B1ZRX1_OPITP|nr:hypothetical protein Oter_1365 [Opitutus terrae PB90-1]